MPPIMNTDSLHDNTPIANLFHNIQTLTEPYDNNMMNSSYFQSPTLSPGSPGSGWSSGSGYSYLSQSDLSSSSTGYSSQHSQHSSGPR